MIYKGQEEQARDAVQWFKMHFPDRFYIELQTHDIPEYDETYRKLITLAHEMEVPLVATNDIHYTKREQADAHDILLCIQTSKTVNESNRMRMSDPSYYMRSPEEMWELYGDVPEALENTLKIADQCDVTLQFAPPYHLPTFPVPEGYTDSESYLHHLCDEGLRWRYGERAQDPDVQERMTYELGIIHDMGFDDYFLIVWDLCEAAKERDIWWNVRGSGAGSIVAYTLGITSVDPLKNRLLFERFLNPARVNMPDIDLDYPDDRREELIAYTVDRYGDDHVAQIITFGTLGARAAIRDVGRAMDIPLSEVDRVARLIPAVPGKPVSISQALEQVQDLKAIYDNTPYIKKLLDTATQVEGVARHASTHAAGVIISDKPTVEYMPLHRPTKGDAESHIGSVSQWPMEIVDAMGMLKVDFLGLRTLTHMRKACELIEKEGGSKLDLTTIPYERMPDDPKKDANVKALYDLLASGDTTGVFQVEGAGMRRTLRELQPSQFQHIVAVLALYRPGPLENIPTYIRRMHGKEEVQYRHPVLAEILDDTYGIIVYQEQIMQIAVEMAGYKAGEADMIRKAVAKKKKALMEKHKKKFRVGAVKRGIPAETADAVWGDIEFFARYGFNRGHATDYAVITAQTAYLKAHYPLEFMTALMTTERHNVEKVGRLIVEARRSGMEVLGPNINYSDLEFTIEHRGEGNLVIRIGLSAIKNVGDEAMRLIVEARKAEGPFESLDDLADRVDLRKLNRKALECLIQAGALDDFGERPALLTVVEAMLSSSGSIHEAREVGQITLFGLMDTTDTIQVPDAYPPIPHRQLLDWEKELLGTYLSEHPMEEQERQLLAQDMVSTTIDRIATETLGNQLTLVGMVQRVRRITTKKGDAMAFATLEGPGGMLDVVVFPRTFERFKGLLIQGRVLVVSGKLDSRQDREEHPLLADWFKEPHELLSAVGNGDALAGSASFVREEPASYDVDASQATEEPADQNAHNGKASSASAPVEVQVTDVAEGGRLSDEGQSVDKKPPEDRVRPYEGQPDTEIEDPDNGHSDRVSPLLPEEPPSPPATLYITLQRTNDNERDFQKLAELHRLLKAQRGADSFVVALKSERHKPVELLFPNENTHITPGLRQGIASIVGQNNLRVIMTEMLDGAKA